MNLTCEQCRLHHVSGGTSYCGVDRAPAYKPDSCRHDAIPDLLSDLAALESENARLRADLDHAIAQAKKEVPHYPWSDKVTVSEAVWALSGSLQGTMLANEDWRKKNAGLREIVEKLYNQSGLMGWLAMHNEGLFDELAEAARGATP